jgi:hypothetical protein
MCVQIRPLSSYVGRDSEAMIGSAGDKVVTTKRVAAEFVRKAQELAIDSDVVFGSTEARWFCMFATVNGDAVRWLRLRY